MLVSLKHHLLYGIWKPLVESLTANICSTDCCLSNGIPVHYLILPDYCECSPISMDFEEVLMY